MKKWIILALAAAGGYGAWRAYKSPKTKEHLMGLIGYLAESEADIENELREWCNA